MMGFRMPTTVAWVNGTAWLYYLPSDSEKSGVADGTTGTGDDDSLGLLVSTRGHSSAGYGDEGVLEGSERLCEHIF